MSGVANFDDEVSGLMHRLHEVLDMVCAWGDIGEGLGAMGDLVECLMLLGRA